MGKIGNATTPAPMYMFDNDAAGRTCIGRSRVSAPTRWLACDGYLDRSQKILDFGCGKGDEAFILKRDGFKIKAYDPYQEAFKRRPSLNAFDVVLCTYVLNVSADDRQMQAMILDAYSHLRKGGKVFFAVRRDIRPKRAGLQRCGSHQRLVYPDQLFPEMIEKIYERTKGFAIYMATH